MLSTRYIIILFILYPIYGRPTNTNADKYSLDSRNIRLSTPLMSNIEINEDMIKSRLNSLNQMKRSFITLFNNLDNKLQDQPASREIFVQFKKRCLDKVNIIRILLPQLERKIKERQQYMNVIDGLKNLMNKRKNETDEIITNIIDNTSDLNDSIQFELLRLLETVSLKSTGNLFNSWQPWMKLVSALDLQM